MSDRVPFKADVEENPRSEQKGHQGVWIEGLDYLSDTNYIKMANYLGLSQREREDSRIANKISFLSDWAGKVGNTEDELKRREIVSKFKRDLGVTYKGEDLVMYLYRYARLDDEKRRIEGEMNLYKPQEEVEEKPKPKPKKKAKPKEKKEEEKAEQPQEIQPIEEPTPDWFDYIYNNNQYG